MFRMTRSCAGRVFITGTDLTSDNEGSQLATDGGEMSLGEGSSFESDVFDE